VRVVFVVFVFVRFAPPPPPLALACPRLASPSHGKDLEASKRLLGIAEYGLSVTTLEEVFLRVAAHAQGQDGDGDGEDGSGAGVRAKQLHRERSVSRQDSRRMSSNLEAMREDLLAGGGGGGHNAALGEAAEAEGGGGSAAAIRKKSVFDDSALTRVRVTGLKLQGMHFYAMIMKRVQVTGNDGGGVEGLV
jgi:hypothetical protein